VLDDHFAKLWEHNSPTEYARRKRRRNGQPNYRLIRYADDFLVVSDGDRNDAQEAKHAAAEVLSQIGLYLSEEKTRITHIDEGFDFLGVRIQRHQHRSNTRHYVYTYPSKPALRAVMAKVKTLTSRATLNWSLTALLVRLNRILRGWAVYHRHGCAKATVTYLHHYTWQRVGKWLKRKHAGITWQDLNRRYCPNGLPTMDGITLFDTQAVAIARYRYRGNRIPTPWDHVQSPASSCGEPDARKRARPVRRAGHGNTPTETSESAP
jgi:RNA-directed DNA polymerase